MSDATRMTLTTHGRSRAGIGLAAGLGLLLAAAACVDGRAKLSHRAAFDQQLDLPELDEFPPMASDEAVVAAVSSHEDEAMALGIDLGGVTGAASLLATIESTWPSLDAAGRQLFVGIFVDLFDAGHALAIEAMRERFADLELAETFYVGIDMRDFARQGTPRAVDRLTASFDAGEFELDLDAFAQQTLRDSAMTIEIAVYLASAEALLATSGYSFPAPTDYVQHAVLRSLGLRTVRSSDLDGAGAVDLGRVRASFEVDTACRADQTPLDWLSGFEIAMMPDQAVYADPFGAVAIVTEDPPDETLVNPWSSLVMQSNLGGGAPVCGVAEAGAEHLYDGHDVTPFLTSRDGFTLAVSLSGTHPFGRLDLVEQIQIMLEVGRE